MANGTPKDDSVRKVIQDARAYGEELGRLLLDCPLPDDEKEAWAALVPFMDEGQIEQFKKMLLTHYERQVFDEAEDVILAMKAAELRRQFADAANIADANKKLDEIEAEIDTLEGVSQTE